MTFSQFLSILRARRLLFIAVLLAVVVPVIVASLLWPKKYIGVASVVVDIKPDPISGISQALVNPGLLATQVDIISSERVARRVIRSLKLTEAPSIRDDWQADTNGEVDIETWLVVLLQKQLDVKPSRESSVITIEYGASDPKFAAGMANAFAQAYLDTVLDLRVDPAKQFSSFFDARAKDARLALEKAQNRLSEFQSEKGVVMTDERMDIENQRLNELTSQLVVMQSLSAESGSRQSQAAGGAADKLQEISSHPVIASLRADIARSEARLQELNAKFGDRHPQVVELKANINELRARIDTEVKRLSAGVGVTNSITRQREAQIRADLDAQRAKVLKMKQVRDEGVLILRDVEAAQRAFEQIQLRATQTNLESQVTATNVTMLTPAVPPAKHSSPKPLLNSFVGVFFGLLLATGAVLLSELRNRRIRHVGDIADVLQLPLLGILPGSDAKAKPRRALSIAGPQKRLIGQTGKV
ncbi:chain length determinant protein EpsF [Pelomonas sp. Root1444]|uniref:chain length determinant protein EpsF n=1 Tax=Pelomonas sp. Root1444 TaxID=1736464 RepID=UPI000702F2DD|nr:chain length determinant protein EpsF [Pelomonas sp. Root1444]KQY82877.1 chain-length determining protein [Pelomonas sp. Root1444]